MGNLETAALLGSSRRESHREQLGMFREQLTEQLGRAATPAEQAEARESLAVLNRMEAQSQAADQLAALGIVGPAAERVMAAAHERRQEKKARRKWRKRCGLIG